MTQCPPGHELSEGLCYLPCKDGYEGEGGYCRQKCPEGYDKDETACKRSLDIYGRRSYIRETGKIPDKNPCPDGMRDDGTSCWMDTYGRGTGVAAKKEDCPPGTRDDGTSCYSDPHVFGRVRAAGWNGNCREDETKKCEGNCGASLVTCYKKCPEGYKNDGLTCRKTDIGIKVNIGQRLKCEEGFEKWGALCYPKCREGYKAKGCCLCEPNGGPGIRVNLMQRQRCNNGKEKLGALCYEKCKQGYKSAPGFLCREEKCKSGYVNDGLTCRRPPGTIKRDWYERGMGKSPLTNKKSNESSTNLDRQLKGKGTSVRAKDILHQVEAATFLSQHSDLLQPSPTVVASSKLYNTIRKTHWSFYVFSVLLTILLIMLVLTSAWSSTSATRRHLIGLWSGLIVGLLGIVLVHKLKA